MELLTTHAQCVKTLDGCNQRADGYTSLSDTSKAIRICTLIAEIISWRLQQGSWRTAASGWEAAVTASNSHGSASFSTSLQDL